MSEDAFDIANRFLDSGAKRTALEVAILRHMEHHIAVEREACAALVDAWPNIKNYTSDRASYGVQMATELADAIRARTQR